MTDREKLIELCEDVILSCRASLCADCEHSNIDYPHCMGVHFADHLIASGVVVREKGEWRNNKDDYPECDKCGYMPQYDPMIDDIYLSDFCPNCGSDMREGENDG